MRIEDAPPAGWYPDPEGSTRLRWWEGEDWSNRYRSFPSNDEQPPPLSAAQLASGGSAGAGWYPDPSGSPGQRWWDGAQWTNQVRGAHQLVDDVRAAARDELSRAAQQFGAQARYAARDVVPLISEYGNKGIKLVKRLVVLVIVLWLAWVLFQAWANQNFFEWIGDRIDNIGDAGADVHGWSWR